MQSTKRINLISGPRNISTALMYSFANRPDTDVVDEPMYAYYLAETGIQYHPATDAILKALPQKLETVLEALFFQELDWPVYFIKGMAHHYLEMDLSFLLKLKNVFLIRDPYQLITSFSKVIQNPTLEDIGLKREWELCNYLLDNGKHPIVLDSNVVLSNPKLELEKLCSKLDIPFYNEMLNWETGPIPQDGVWAKYWYASVWKSTCFQKQKSSTDKMPERFNSLYEESLVYYNLLKEA